MLYQNFLLRFQIKFAKLFHLNCILASIWIVLEVGTVETDDPGHNDRHLFCQLTSLELLWWLWYWRAMTPQDGTPVLSDLDPMLERKSEHVHKSSAWGHVTKLNCRVPNRCDRRTFLESHLRRLHRIPNSPPLSASIHARAELMIAVGCHCLSTLYSFILRMELVGTTFAKSVENLSGFWQARSKQHQQQRSLCSILNKE